MKKKGGKKYVVRNNVFFVGLKNLHIDDQKRIKEIIFNDYITLERELKKINSLKLTFKIYEKGGKKKYSIKLLVDAHTHPITVDHMSSAAEWDAVACVHQVLKKAKSQITHKYKTDSSYRKPYEKGVL